MTVTFYNRRTKKYASLLTDQSSANITIYCEKKEDDFIENLYTFIYLIWVVVIEECFFSTGVFENAETAVTLALNRLNVAFVLLVDVIISGGRIALGFSVGSNRFKIL